MLMKLVSKIAENFVGKGENAGTSIFSFSCKVFERFHPQDRLKQPLKLTFFFCNLQKIVSAMI